MIEKSNNNLDRPVSLKQLADELGFHSSSIRKIVVRRGFRIKTFSPGLKPLASSVPCILSLFYVSSQFQFYEKLLVWQKDETGNDNLLSLKTMGNPSHFF